MRLNVLERLKLLIVLPEQGNLATLRMVRKLRQQLEFSELEMGTDELTAYLFAGGKAEDPSAPRKQDSPNVVYVPAKRDVGGNVVRNDYYAWDRAWVGTKECKISPAARQLIVDTLTRLDRDGALTFEFMSLCDKFMDAPDDAPDDASEDEWADWEKKAEVKT